MSYLSSLGVATVRAAIVLASLLTVSATSLRAQAPGKPGGWPQELHDALEEVIVQHEGRIKPLLTEVGVAMLEMSNKRTLVVPRGDDEIRLDPMDWWLDVVLRPELADEYRVFKVTDIAAVEQAGISADSRKKRDSFSYAELAPGIDRLMAQAREFFKVEESKRTRIQKQTMHLATKVMSYQSMRHMFDWARHDFDLGGNEAVQARFNGASTATYSQILARSESLLARYNELDRAADMAPAAAPEEYRVLGRILDRASRYATQPLPLKLIPRDESRPGADVSGRERVSWEVWRDPMTLAAARMGGEGVTDRELAIVASLENFARATTNERRLDAVKALLRESASLRESRGIGEGDQVALEVFYHSSNLHWHAGWMFLLAFLVGLVGMVLTMRPNVQASALVRWGSFGILGVGWVMLVTAIVVRCMILSRPPVSTLYETILFIGAVVVLFAMIAEWFYRRGFAVTVAGAAGALAMVGAHRFEEEGGRDTFTPLQAVLDDNFWLATHVTTINIGYAAAMLAAIIGAVAIVSFAVVRVLHPGKEPARYREFFKTCVAKVYGVTCAGVLIGTVGTILGGVWANDSWGRFWGWDPKENGALLIILAQLFLLHGRLAGILRPFGQCMVATLTGCVVIFSWFGTNQLGVGLHAYGFSESLQTAITIGYYSFCTCAGIGAVGWTIDWAIRRQAAAERARGLAGSGSAK